MKIRGYYLVGKLLNLLEPFCSMFLVTNILSHLPIQRFK